MARRRHTPLILCCMSLCGIRTDEKSPMRWYRLPLFLGGLPVYGYNGRSDFGSRLMFWGHAVAIAKWQYGVAVGSALPAASSLPINIGGLALCEFYHKHQYSGWVMSRLCGECLDFERGGTFLLQVYFEAMQFLRLLM